MAIARQPPELHAVGESLDPDRQPWRKRREHDHHLSQRRISERRDFERDRVTERRDSDVQSALDYRREQHADSRGVERSGVWDVQRDDQWLRRRADALYHLGPFNSQCAKLFASSRSLDPDREPWGQRRDHYHHQSRRRIRERRGLERNGIAHGRHGHFQSAFGYW